MARLVVQDLTFAYPRRPPVLREVSLEVLAGETVALVGPNGAGKSTLLGLAAGRLVPDRGRVRLDGDEVHRLDRRAAARRIAGQAAAEDPTFPFTVRETLELGRHPWRGAFGPLSAEDAARVRDALGRTELEGLADRPLAHLSSGERQRAALGRCLVQEGDLVLLDEPTSHLDLGHRQRLLGTFALRARERGQALLLALHDLNLAAVFADRIVLLVEGEVVADGPPADVLTRERIEAAFDARVRVLSDGPVVLLGEEAHA